MSVWIQKCLEQNQKNISWLTISAVVHVTRKAQPGLDHVDEAWAPVLINHGFYKIEQKGRSIGIARAGLVEIAYEQIRPEHTCENLVFLHGHRLALLYGSAIDGKQGCGMSSPHASFKKRHSCSLNCEITMSQVCKWKAMFNIWLGCFPCCCAHSLWEHELKPTWYYIDLHVMVSGS